MPLRSHYFHLFYTDAKRESLQIIHTLFSGTGQKRLVDIILASVALFIVSPLLVFLAVCIKLDSDGPVFYRGLRAGRCGQPFHIFKLRSMVVHVETQEASWTASDDPRITRVGSILRRFKLDELPQLINVIKGDMSLVGPRPEAVEAVRLYTDEERQLLTVRPGLTDWASIKFCQEGDILRDALDPVSYYYHHVHPEKVRLGLEYVQNPSLLIDLRIICLTLCRLIRG